MFKLMILYLFNDSGTSITAHCTAQHIPLFVCVVFPECPIILYFYAFSGTRRLSAALAR